MAYSDILAFVEVAVEEAFRGHLELLYLAVVLDEVKFQIRHLVLNRLTRFVEEAPVEGGAGDRLIRVGLLHLNFEIVKGIFWHANEGEARVNKGACVV